MQVLIRGQAQTHRLYASIIARRRTMLGLEIPRDAAYSEHAEIFKDHPEGFIKCVKYSKHASDATIHYFDPNTLIPSKEECILDNFLIEQKKRYDNSEENAYFMRDEQMHYLLADMFGAGLDTTATTLSWYLLFIAIHQEEQVIYTSKSGMYELIKYNKTNSVNSQCLFLGKSKKRNFINISRGVSD